MKIADEAWNWSVIKRREGLYNSYPNTSIKERSGGSWDGHKILTYDPPVDMTDSQERHYKHYLEFERAWVTLPKQKKHGVWFRFVLGGAAKEDGNMPTLAELGREFGIEFRNKPYSGSAFDGIVRRGLKTVKWKMGL